MPAAPKPTPEHWTLAALHCADLPKALAHLREQATAHPDTDISGFEAILRHHFETLGNTNHIDPLTGTLRREAFELRAAALIDLARRHTTPLTVVLADLDHLKQLNDTQGHAAGDQALADFGTTLRNSLRSSDLAGRFGGDEFILLLPHTDGEGAAHLMARLSPAPPFQWGQASLSDQTPDLARLIATADAALLNAKRCRP